MNERPAVAYVQKTCQRCGSKIEVVSGASLRAIRERAEISLRTAALRFGCSAGYLCDIERGNRRCPDRILRFYEGLARRSA